MARTPLFRQFICTLQTARRQNLEAAGEPLPLSRQQVKWTRRRLVKSAMLAGGAALTASPLSYVREALSQPRSGGTPRIAVVGGGIAGLNAAYQLKKAGLNAIVYEARQRLGGRIRSTTGAVGDGLVVDLGGSFINSDHEDMLDLLKEFGLKTFNRLQDAKRFPFPETGYFFDGRFRPEREVADKLRPLALQISQDAKLLDQDFDRFAPILDRLSVAQYFGSTRPPDSRTIYPGTG
jgi:monoamine oxidase